MTITTERASRLFLGGDHTCMATAQDLGEPALTLCWSENSHGQLTDGTTDDAISAPVEAAELAALAGGNATCGGSGSRWRRTRARAGGLVGSNVQPTVARPIGASVAPTART